MSYDLHQIKERLDLPDIFRRDGHQLRRMGGSEFCRCPFHDEKSASCKVELKRFHCFGCGAGSDIFDYWERSRDLSKSEAIEQLALVAGITADVPGFSRPITPAKPKPKAEEIISPLTSEETAAWLAAVDRLASQPSQIARIAAWRGFSEDTVRWAVAQGVMGLEKWSGILREAFLVEMPVAPSGPYQPVSVHIRLGPHTRGNERPKVSWRYTPTGRGAWPLIFGDLATATTVFMVEGQWDALALVDLMGWHASFPAGLAVVAMRGATSFRKLIAHYAFHPRATVFAIADADLAGAEWFEPGGFIELLTPRIGRVFTFWPGERGLDLNDLVKRGLDRPQMIAMLAPKLPSKRHRKASGPTFVAWCRARKSWMSAIGNAARAVLADKDRPTGRVRQSVWERHWKNLHLSEERLTELRLAWETYKSECSAS